MGRWLSLIFMILFVPLTLRSEGIPLNPPIPEGLGVNISFTNPRPGEMKEMAAVGIHWVRIAFRWENTERVKGKYDFSAYDHLIAALEPYHIRAIFTLCDGNKFYDHGLAPYTSAGRRAFTRWAVAAVQHFRGHGILWEMWNEPNGIFWKPKANTRNYILLARAVGKAIRKSEPDELYVGPSAADNIPSSTTSPLVNRCSQTGFSRWDIDWPFLAECFRAGLLNYWDGVTVHPYRQSAPETVAPQYTCLRKLIAKYSPKGKRIPIISGEWGYPSIRDWWGIGEVGQAKLLARQWLTNLSNEVPISIWFDWLDGSDPHDPESHWGMARFAYHAGRRMVYTPKPAYWSARTLTHLLDGYRFRERLPIGRSDDYVLVFRRGQKDCLAVWTSSPAPHRVQIRSLQGSFSVWNFEGKREKQLQAGHGGLSVTLTDGPQYLASPIPAK